MGDFIGGKDRDAEQDAILRQQKEMTQRAQAKEERLARREREDKRRLNRERIAALRGRFGGFSGGAQEDTSNLFTQITGK